MNECFISADSELDKILITSSIFEESFTEKDKSLKLEGNSDIDSYFTKFDGG